MRANGNKRLDKGFKFNIVEGIDMEMKNEDQLEPGAIKTESEVGLDGFLR